ncbi:Uncharacterized protein FKW44_006908 [Caligus rogercresseyi]|uniref:Uncharacterized protein n=1 Tax=Caligus rogercresseyi TaxID=217165 RepID=A0A7T8KDY2_CALRO|nr:Uncharacterized protein FKW44_006908 [Caligus rogercresseyi]
MSRDGSKSVEEILDAIRAELRDKRSIIEDRVRLENRNQLSEESFDNFSEGTC